MFMQKAMAVTFSLILAAVSGCAAQTAWTPTLDPYNDPNPHRLAADQTDCQQLASQASNGMGKETLKGVAIGGLIGAALGAAVGAATGGIGGGAQQGISAEGQYKRMYINCLRNRRHNVLN
jgi:outer membrane lipoprotein SlyB